MSLDLCTRIGTDARSPQRQHLPDAAGNGRAHGGLGALSLRRVLVPLVSFGRDWRPVARSRCKLQGDVFVQRRKREAWHAKGFDYGLRGRTQRRAREESVYAKLEV